jgi:hypothetical protein
MTIVTVIDQLLNSSTGYQEDQPILSVAIPRSTLDSLNLDTIDPSESMSKLCTQHGVHEDQGLQTS